MKEYICQYCGRTYTSAEDNPAACAECQACMDEAALDIASDLAAAPGAFFVVDQTDAIHKEGTEAECRAFLADPITKEIAAAGGLAFGLVSAEAWQLRDRAEDLTEDEPAADPGRADPEPLDSSDGITLPSREEMRAFWQQQRKLDEWAQSLTAEQLCKLSDAGYYNSSMKGYCIRAAREMGLDDDQTRTLLRCFSYALDVMNKDDAERLYNSSQF